MQELRKLTSALIAAATLVSLAGCASGPSSLSTAGAGQIPAVLSKTVRPDCAVTVWASSPSTNTVYGYSSPFTVCITLTGPFAGTNLSDPQGLATDENGYLYVADTNNHRVVIFSANGTYVKQWRTLSGGHQYKPVGLCTGDIDHTKSAVGVLTHYDTNNTQPGLVEFFPQYAPNNSVAFGTATGALHHAGFCAFDVKENFFADGATSGGNRAIAYLSGHHFTNGWGAYTMTSSGLGNAPWTGMYSRIDSPVDDTLTVGTSANATTQTALNWNVTCGVVVCTFVSTAPYLFTGFSTGAHKIYQLAPTTGGSLGTVYIADGATNTLDNAPANGGPAGAFATLTGPLGVATEPTGQY